MDSPTERSLFVDLYELTMAQVYWQRGMSGQATFSLTFRSYPPNRAYFVLAGLDEVLDFLEGFEFARESIEYLRSTDLFDPGFLDYLTQLRFTGDLRSMAEGRIFFTNEPVLEVTAPIIEAQIVETYLMNRINLHSIMATKASRVVHEARDRTVVDFAARRAHGVDAANALARASYMVGFAGTSNVMAGRLYGIPIFGTMAHSLVQSFQDEKESFRAYADSFPDTSTFLVDTYDTIEGVRRAIPVALDMRRRGHRLRAVRLDSGDLLDLSVKARALLDEAGLRDVQVFASGGLDEFAVAELIGAGAPIDGVGVGTKIGVSADAPWTDCAYKLVEYEGRPSVKLSAGKHSVPGAKQVFRHRHENGTYVSDTVGLAGERPPEERDEPLLKQVMREGRRREQPESLERLREKFKGEFEQLPEQHKALESPATYRVTIRDALHKLSREVAEQTRSRESGA